MDGPSEVFDVEILIRDKLSKGPVIQGGLLKKKYTPFWVFILFGDRDWLTPPSVTRLTTGKIKIQPTLSKY